MSFHQRMSTTNATSGDFVQQFAHKHTHTQTPTGRLVYLAKTVRKWVEMRRHSYLDVYPVRFLKVDDVSVAHLHGVFDPGSRDFPRAFRPIHTGYPVCK